MCTIHNRHNSPWPQNQVAVSADSAQTTRKILGTLWAECVQKSGEFALSLSCPGNQSLAPQLPFITVLTKLAQGWQDPSRWYQPGVCCVFHPSRSLLTRDRMGGRGRQFSIHFTILQAGGSSQWVLSFPEKKSMGLFSDGSTWLPWSFSEAYGSVFGSRI